MEHRGVPDPDRHGARLGLQSADARNGPLAGNLGLTVDGQDDKGRWPTPVVWAGPCGERHLYELVAVAVRSDTGQSPIYEFGRTLGSAEADPPKGSAHPRRFLL